MLQVRGTNSGHWRTVGGPLVPAAIMLLLAACAPSVSLTGAAVSSELQRTALVAFHRMEIAFLETGSYTTNALIDLELPRGVKWTLEDFSERSYRLRFTADNRPGEAWLVSPAGLMPAPNTAGT
jgi:hypothetical protein